LKVVLDIEADALNPEKVKNIWVIVCKEVETGKLHFFREVTKHEHVKEEFLRFAERVSTWIGHNILGYDYPVLNRLIGFSVPDIHLRFYDTLIASKLVDYSRKNGHSLEAWGEEIGYPKLKFSDFTKYSKELEDYCVRDVEVNLECYLRLYLVSRSWISNALALEQEFQGICNSLHSMGFGFDRDRAVRLLEKVQQELGELDEKIKEAFPPRLRPIREINPEYTRYGTLNRTDFRWAKGGDLSEYNGGPFTRCEWKEFNPSSHRQLISVLNEAAWRPTDKTETHKDAEREKRRAKGQEVIDLETKLNVLSTYGWKINEENLATLPPNAPSGARSLAKRILLESRRRTLTEWLGLVQDDGRIHGKFYGIGAWTHRMAHQEPNTANIPREFKEDGSKKLLGKELRSLWIASPKKKKLLVGVDAEGIQLRIFAHYIDDPEFTHALVKGRKDDKSDPHSLNQRILGSICKTRQAAKRFIYALLLGAGINKLCEILEAGREETQEALDRLLLRYTGWQMLREEVFPKDAKRGYFTGLDGRKVALPGETSRDKQHLAMSGYLQNGEAIIIKRAACIAQRKIRAAQIPWNFVDIVHDELQSEVDNDLNSAIMVAKIKADAIVEAGEYYKLKCPLAGSYINDHGEYTIGTNWYQTH
jgi:DNA polymerase-1